MPVGESVSGDEQLVRYLLGLLPEDETERLDELTMVDDTAASRLREVEHDLIDAYVAGTLDAETRRRFDQVYLATAHRRRKVEFATRFLATLERKATAGPAAACACSPASDVSITPERPPRKTAGRILEWPMLVAAALLLIACGVFALQHVPLRNRAGAVSRRAAEPGRPLQALADRPSDAHDAVNPLASGEAAALGAPPIVLFPQTRAVAAIPVVAVAGNAERVGFDLRLESNEFARYQVALRDPGNNRVAWRSAILAPRPVDKMYSLAIVVPASSLKTQHYAFELAGIGAAGHAETVGSYAIQVERR